MRTQQRDQFPCLVALPCPRGSGTLDAAHARHGNRHDHCYRAKLPKQHIHAFQVERIFQTEQILKFSSPSTRYRAAAVKQKGRGFILQFDHLIRNFINKG